MMKTIKYSNGSIKQILMYNNGRGIKAIINNRNGKGELHGLSIGYWINGNLWWKVNYVNNKEYGLETKFYDDGLINERIYYL